MLTEVRKNIILEGLNEKGKVEVAELSKQLGENADTIRRDIRELASEGKLQKVYGGALALSKAVYPFEERSKQDTVEKRALANRALEFLLPHQVIGIDGGTTNLLLVQTLPKHFQATVITHSPHIAVALIDHPQIEVILIGGKIFKHSMVSVGSQALESIQNFNIDLFVLGATGVHEQSGITTGDYEDAQIKSAFVKRSAEVLLMATTEKMRKISPYKICDFDKVQHLIF